jgi:phage tail-like protein
VPAPIPDERASESLRASEPLAGFRFSVHADGLAGAYFSECSGVTADIKVDSYEEGGANLTTRKFPGRASYSNVTLKRGLTKDNRFLDWFLSMANGGKVRKSVTISIWTPDTSQPLQHWQLMNAFPAKYSIPALQVTANGVLIESVEFAHEGISSYVR